MYENNKPPPLKANSENLRDKKQKTNSPPRAYSATESIPQNTIHESMYFGV